VALKTTGFGGSEAALKRASCVARLQWLFEVTSLCHWLSWWCLEEYGPKEPRAASARQCNSLVFMWCQL